ncbi:M24 family metallopeptidase [Croceicoccus gelatinilyticus]|uniref:M24 family metallopeptidase n=1 Tax=Croceicoccus gelatinilyticus TaxID=2835536 RepID=UPI001BD0C94B|nr:M24 family metallopeptidase [Croceicoccus gelatinilyticus]MBS7670049.1 aminopeptidase P family protein [Croceicoccus gelatinilyticus]
MTEPSNPRAERLRRMMGEEGYDAVVLSHPHDVRYAVGYHSILERWGQMEAMAAAIVYADPAKPLTLVIPEANLGLVAVLNQDGPACTFAEIRTFEMLNFCEVSRYLDPDRDAGQLGEDAMAMAGLIKGSCQPDIAAAVSSALADNGMAGKRIGFDEHRMSARISDHVPHEYSDVLDFMMRVRVVKTDGELERYRKVGKLADRIIDFAGSVLYEGADWNDVQARICDFMVRNEVIPVDEGAMLFGGAYEQDEFIPDLFRTRGNRSLRKGDIVILETQGIHDSFWVDINRTAVIGPPSAEYQRQHDVLRDAFVKMVDQLRPGMSTADLPAIGYEHLKANGVATPEKLLVVAHGIGLMPLEIPLPYPAAGLAGVKEGFVLEEGMLLSLDSLYFGAKVGPCHMENVYAITSGAPEPMYDAPLELIVAPLAAETEPAE